MGITYCKFLHGKEILFRGNSANVQLQNDGAYIMIYYSI